MLPSASFVSGRVPARSQRRAAFTLTEIAIVIGIFGLILAGIWAASATVSSGNQSNRASDQLNIISSNLITFYAGQNASFAALNGAHALNPVPLAVPSAAGADFCYYTPTMTPSTTAVFPKEMMKAGLSNNVWSTATSCGGTVGSAQVSLAKSAGGAPALIAVRYTSVPVQRCLQLVMKNSMPGPDTRLQEIAVTGASGTTKYIPGTTTCSVGSACPLPPTPTNVNTGCGTTGTVTIDWYFQLGG
jgi:type II secretory pathway pseudopilin PulG